MRSLRDFGNALVVALISVGLMIGALSISLVGFAPQATPTTENNQLPSPLPLTVTSTIPPTLTPTLGLVSPTPSATPTYTNTALPPPSCLPPSGWGQIIIQAGDTLDSIATRYRTSKDELRRANCLLTDNLVAGTVLYAPPVPTTTTVSCIPGAAGWVKRYTVRPGETFYSIATNHYTTSNLLKRVNCRTSDLLLSGEVLWVPNIATRTPYPTPMPGSTITPYPTDSLTETALPFTVTVIPSDTPIPATATEVPTFTAVPTPTPSPTPFPE